MLTCHTCTHMQKPTRPNNNSNRNKQNKPQDTAGFFERHFSVVVCTLTVARSHTSVSHVYWLVLTPAHSELFCLCLHKFLGLTRSPTC